MKLKQPDIKGFSSFEKEKSFSKPTPMMAQYLEVKERHKDYLLFYRMGDFYELFFDDAKIASQHLGITLTKRGKINDNDIPMCGVPAHASQTYLSRLIKGGFKVAIAEQLSEVPNKKLDKKTPKIFKRDVVRIITPGTILEDSLLESKSHNHLLSINFLKGDLSLAWVDMTTGTIKIQRISGLKMKEDLFECINKVEPGEIIISQELSSSIFWKEKLKNFEKIISIIPDDFFKVKKNNEKLKDFFKNSKINLKNNFLDSDKCVLGALINYLELTQKKNIPQIKNFEIIDKNDFMQIDMFSEKSLEIFQKSNGEKKGSLLEVIDLTKTSAGGRLLRDFLKNPLTKKEEITFRHKLVQKFLNKIEVLKKTTLCLSGLPDAERALSRISARTNNPRDLILISVFMEKANQVFENFKDSRNVDLEELIPEKTVIKNANVIMQKIKDQIEDSPPLNLADVGVIKSKVDKKLDNLRNIKTNRKNDILDLQSKYALATNINNLKIKFNNFHGYFVEITNKNFEKIQKCEGINFRLIQNTINTTRFQTDELKSISTEIENAELKSIDLETKIFEGLCDQTNNQSSSISEISKTLSFVDVITSFSSLSLERNYVQPSISKDKANINILDGRHPVVEESLKKDGQEFTPNDCLLDKKTNTWLMTGPNMAGKSTFLRQTAIIVLLNQIGCFVPARSATLSIFDKIFTRIGASDDLSQGMSTFMSEMVETSRIVSDATDRSLVILDELGRGTSTEDGLAIARAVLEFILKRKKSVTLFATHYKELCSLASKFNEIKLKTLQIKKWNEEIIFLYKVVDGISEGSFGIHVANLAGIDEKIVLRAKSILKNINYSKKESKVNLEDPDFEIEDKGKKYKEIFDLINKLELDSLSPKESLDILYTIKKNYL